MIYRNIRNLREDSDITQTKIAEALGVSQRLYSYYENGQRTLTPEMLCKIADFHGVSVDYLLDRTEIKTPYRQR